MSLNLALILRESAQKTPDHLAVILESFKLTYGQLDAQSSQVASSLEAAGLKKGDRVGLMLPNVPQFPMAYFGILKAGGVVVPMNVLFKAPEVSFYMGDSESRVLIVWEDFAGEALKGIENLKGITTYVALKPGSSAPPPGTKSFMELMAGDPRFDMEPTSGDDTAVILYTSGTTGKPKGAEITHSNLFMNCHFISHVFDSTDDDVFLCVLPMFHSFGQTSVMNVAIHVGATLTQTSTTPRPCASAAPGAHRSLARSFRRSRRSSGRPSSRATASPRRRLRRRSTSASRSARYSVSESRCSGSSSRSLTSRARCCLQARTTWGRS